MLTRRQMLKRTLGGSSLLALGSTVPGFVASTARAAEMGKDQVLVVVELAGGNDGLNTVIPYADALYHEARPTLGFKKKDVLRVDDSIGLHPALRPLESLLEDNQLAILQGVGYPNPNRSHFESMDIWQTADPRRRLTNGWLGRTLGSVTVTEGGIPAFYVGNDKLPLALEGSATGVPSLHPEKPFEVQLSGKPERSDEDVAFNEPPTVKSITPDGKSPPDADAARRKLIRELSALGSESPGTAGQFVRRTSLQTFTTIERLKKIMRDFHRPQGDYQVRGNRFQQVREGLEYELKLVSSMIQAGFGTRIYYVGIDGFDTHSDQASEHQRLLGTLANAVRSFYQELSASGDASRVLLMTFSEFGRRVKENGSKGTDHGSGSCMFVAGPAARGGLIGKHPSLEASALAAGDVRYHTDFRQVYATLLDQWLGVDSRRVLNGEFDHVPLLKKA